MSTEKKVSVKSVITMLINKAECESDAETGRDGVFLPLPIEEFIKVICDMGDAVAGLTQAAIDALEALQLCIDALSSKEQDDHDALARLTAAIARVGGAP